MSRPIGNNAAPQRLAMAMLASVLLPAAAAADARNQVAQTERQYDFDLPRQPLARSLDAFSRITGWQVGYASALADGRAAPALRGTYSPDRALRRLLAGTGLGYRLTAEGTVTLERLATEDDAGVRQLAPITVEGAAPRGRFGDAPPEPGSFKAEYQTTATKTPLPLRETPQTISVVTRESLQDRAVQDLGNALETVAGVHQYTGSGPFGGIAPFGFDEVQIRGVALSGDLDIREDGFINPTFFSRPDLVIYERIEAVKGPTSVLYGRGNAGGFINRVRKKPLPEQHLQAAAEIGSFQHYRAEGDVTGPLFASNRARGRLVAAYQDEGSFVDGVESDRGVFAPSLEVDVTDRTRLLLQGLYQNDQFIPNAGFPLVAEGNGKFRAPDVRRSLFFGVPNTDENEWEVFTGSAQVDQRLGDDWLATLKLSRSTQNSPIDVDSYAYGIAPNGDVYLYSSSFDFDTDVWSGELQLRGDIELFGRPVTVLAGVDHFDQKQVRTDAFIALGTANIYAENFGRFPTIQPTTISRHSVIDNDSTGAYAQLVVRPVERLRLLFGGRHDWADSAYVDRLAGTIAQTEDTAFTFRVGASFDVLANVALYALYAESFSPDVFSVARGGQILDPETGMTFEAGVKSEWLDGRVAANLSVFRIERDDVAIPDPNNGPGEFFSIAGGLQRSDGIELEVNGEPLPGWQVSFAGSLLDSEFVEADDPFFGSKPAGTADWQVGFHTSYELQSGPLKGFGLGGGVFAIGDRGVSSFIAGAELDGYERVDLAAFYNGFEDVSIRLQVRNVLDDKYVAGADRTGAGAHFGSPRAALLTVRAHW